MVVNFFFVKSQKYVQGYRNTIKNGSIEEGKWKRGGNELKYQSILVKI